MCQSGDFSYQFQGLVEIHSLETLGPAPRATVQKLFHIVRDPEAVAVLSAI